jgi:hypothetical protein
MNHRRAKGARLAQAWLYSFLAVGASACGPTIRPLPPSAPSRTIAFTVLATPDLHRVGQYAHAVEFELAVDCPGGGPSDYRSHQVALGRYELVWPAECRERPLEVHVTDIQVNYGRGCSAQSQAGCNFLNVASGDAPLECNILCTDAEGAVSASPPRR